MKNYPIAERYARGLASTVQDNAELIPITESLAELTELYLHSCEIHSVLSNPSIRTESRIDVLEAIIKAGNFAATVGQLAKSDLLFERPWSRARKVKFCFLPDEVGNWRCAVGRIGNSIKRWSDRVAASPRIDAQLQHLAVANGACAGFRQVRFELQRRITMR